MLEKNKQALLFNFGKDLSYFVVLWYKLRHFIKICDGYVNDPIQGDFQKTLLLSHIGKKSFVEYRLGGEGGNGPPDREIYETWWKSQFWGAELGNWCHTGEKGGDQPRFDK